MKRAVLIVVVALGVAGSSMAVVTCARHSIKANERAHTRIGLVGIICDLSNYSYSFKRLPPSEVKGHNGEPLSSWRFVNAAFLLGDAVQTGFYGQHAHVRKSWDSPENRIYVTGPYREYMGSPLSYIDQSRPGNKARFVAIQGPGTAFDENRRILFSDLPAGVMLVAETRGCEFHWMEPGGDLDIRTMPRQVGQVGGIGPALADADEFFIGFADKSVWLLRSDVPFAELEKFFTIEGARTHDRENVLRSHAVRVWNLE